MVWCSICGKQIDRTDLVEGKACCPLRGGALYEDNFSEEATLVKNSSGQRQLTVRDAVHKLQLCLLEGINDENLLSAAGSLISRGDYQDVVTERTIAEMCGYPLCRHSLKSERPRKGHYRISLKEHKVYDIRETYMFCSSDCLISSRTFSASLQEERSLTLNIQKLNEVLNLFGMNTTANMGKDGELGFSELKIQEKQDIVSGDVSLDEWIGPSDAIDGYVPQREQYFKSQEHNTKKEFLKNVPLDVPDLLSSDVGFASVILTQDEYSVSKTILPVKSGESQGKVTTNAVYGPGKSEAPFEEVRKTKPKKLNKHKPVTEANTGPCQIVDPKETHDLKLRKESSFGPAVLKSSLKTSASKKAAHGVSWADEKNLGDNDAVCDVLEMKGLSGLTSCAKVTDEEACRLASAQACAGALLQATDATASGKSDTSDAVSEAGVIIFPLPKDVEDNFVENDGGAHTKAQVKKSPKQGFSNAGLFDCDDSWYDSPPEGFNLSLSPFSTMFMALFAWISSSSLAYIYGRDQISHEDYVYVNGREYPHRIVLPDGRSSEIKNTLAGCLARALPELVAELRLPIPISNIEKGMGRLLNTMSFLDPLPALSMKQWQVLALLFLDALSVSRISALSAYEKCWRVRLPKVLEDARISPEEFELLKDLIIPLGRC